VAQSFYPKQPLTPNQFGMMQNALNTAATGTNISNLATGNASQGMNPEWTTSYGGERFGMEQWGFGDWLAATQAGMAQQASTTPFEMSPTATGVFVANPPEMSATATGEFVGNPYYPSFASSPEISSGATAAFVEPPVVSDYPYLAYHRGGAMRYSRGGAVKWELAKRAAQRTARTARAKAPPRRAA